MSGMASIPPRREPDGARPGRKSALTRGWWAAHKWLLLRRASQVFFLLLFLTGPLFGLWIAAGTLASSLTLGILPLTDPLVALQSMLAGNWPEAAALIGAAIVLAAYGLVGGRMYCSWVCPVNPVTDLAHWLRVRLDLDKGWQPRRSTRYWVLAAVLAVSALTGTIAWEFVNPVTILHRGIVFGTLFVGFGWAVLLSIFLFDLAVSRHGWCGHFCPVGAFYGLVGMERLPRVSAVRRDVCDDCMECYAVCPEPQVIVPALTGRRAKPATDLVSPLILSPDCTNCGRCIDVCALDVFRFTHRFDHSTAAPAAPAARNGAGTTIRAGAGA